jgi:ATP-dependent DNA helicase RecQ
LDQKKIKSLKVLQYVREDRACRKAYLIKYFSEEVILDCGKCDYCLKKIKFDPKNCKKEILDMLSEESLDLDQLIIKSSYSKEELIDTLKMLLNKEVIVQTKFLKFKIDQ